MDTPFFVLKIVKVLTPRSGAVDVDPCQVIFGGASSCNDPVKKSFRGKKMILYRFYGIVILHKKQLYLML